MPGEVAQAGAGGQGNQRPAWSSQFVATAVRLVLMFGVMQWMRRGQTPAQPKDGAMPRFWP